MKGHSPRSSLLLALAAALCAVLALPSVSSAQGGYFGRNKVQYREFKFKVLKTDHFDVYYYPEEETAAKLASRMAERWYTRLSQLLNHELSTRQPLILYASGTHFRQTNAVEGELGEGTGGVTEAYKRRIVLPFAGPIESSDHVLGHELVHAFQYDITNTNVSSGAGGALELPLWFIEGMAEYLSLGPVDAQTAMWMREATRREKLPDVDDLDNPRYFPYRYGQALWAYIAGKYGDGVVGNMLRAGGGRDAGYEVAIKSVLNIDTKQLSKDWHAAEFDAFRPIAETTKMPASFSRLVTVKHRPGEMNVGPELSPDGSRIIYYSERDLFSIDLYLADAKSGEIIRKLTDTATDGHYESIEFLGSAGAWDPSGKRFVFPGVTKGEPVLTIVDVNNGKTEREIKLGEVHEVINPSWSPDGKQIAFSALVGGFNDLYIYDLEQSALRRLTTDPYAEVEPAWSPDGKSIAFSTDRFTTNLDNIKSGQLRLAVMNVESGAVREVGGFANAKNISPQWASDGKTLFFVSDRQGVSNIYRISADGGQPAQLTNMLTGASGITSLSPAMSAAGGRLVFSAYEEDGYNIYALDSADQLAGTPVVELPRNAAILPPRRDAEGLVFEALKDPSWGLPPATETTEAEDYKAKWGLDYVGQPSFGIGVNPFGTYAAGGVAFLFSDMLGNHVIGTSAQVSSRFDEFGGTLFYLNRTHRWNWGVSLDQTPYVSRGYSAGYSGNNYVEQEIRYLQRDQSLQSFVSYPFSRSYRVEFGGGFRRIAQKYDVTENTYDAYTGQLLDRTTTPIETFDTVSLGEASTALVYDTSIFGATSPIRGSRYRMEVSQSAGDLTFSGLLGDFRTYLMPKRPFTIALRGMYYGRLGRSAENELLPTLFLGYPGLVRGYDEGSFDQEECGNNSNGSCPVFDRLIGSRVAIGNAELRFPIWGAFGGQQFYGPLPIEAAIFADGGVAWGQSLRSGFSAGDNKPVASVGAAIRVNAFNFAVVEIDYVRPLDRPQKGWIWQFTLRPGF